MARRIRYVCRKLGPYARPHRAWLAGGLLAALVVVACRLAFPWPLRGVMELLYAEGGRRGGGVLAIVPTWADPLIFLAAAFLLIVLCQGGAELAQRLAFARFSIRMVHDARAAAVGSILNGTPDPKQLRDPGDLIARVIGDSARIKAGLKGVLIHVAQNGIYLLGVCVLLLLVDFQLGLIFAAGLVAVAAVSGIGTTICARLARQHRRKEGVYAAKFHRALEENESSGGFKKTNDVSSRADAEITRVEGLTTWAVHAVLGGSTCAILIAGVQGVQGGRLAPADLFTFLAYILLVHNPTVRLGRQATRLGRVLASAERLAGVFDGRGKPRRTPPRLVPLAGQLELRDALLRKRVSLSIRRGERVAVIGRSGSGKSTLLQLLGGLAEPHKGDVQWDGIDLHAARAEDRQTEIGYLPAAPTWPRRKLCRVAQLPAGGTWPESVLRIAKKSRLVKLVGRLPQGLDSQLSSYELSLKHRKAFALLGVIQSPASVWLLDDPVGELSTKRANKVLDEILQLAGDRTVVVAMEKSTHIAKFDRVIVVRRGAIRYDGPAVAWLERKHRQVA